MAERELLVDSGNKTCFTPNLTRSPLKLIKRIAFIDVLPKLIMCFWSGWLKERPKMTNLHAHPDK